MLTLSLPSLIGCVPVDFSSMHPRRKYCGAIQPVDKVSYLPIRWWLLALISCRLSNACAISVFSLTLTWRCVPKSLRHARSVLLPFDNYEAYADLCQTTWCSRSSWRWCFPGLTTAPQLLPAFPSNSWTGLVCAERRCTADLQSLSSRPHSAVTAQITLASDVRTRFVPAGSASVSLPPRLCTWLPDFRSSARVTPQHTSTTALFDYISAGRCTHCAFYHWRQHFPATAASIWNSLPKSVRSSPSLQVFRSRLKTERFSSLTAMTKNVSLHWLLLRDFTV